MVTQENHVLVNMGFSRAKGYCRISLLCLISEQGLNLRLGRIHSRK
ncbi:MAG: hypothetical protein LBR91_01400 [Puniceicoccales bacterium]|nr:hypothetical protein [Puniceicoccales bacterium]